MGFLEIGPHSFPPRPEGAQVIQRGPHGMRFAADPVRTREGKLRGSGFRFWTEQQVLNPSESWNPKQAVVGVMGLGAAKEEPSSSTKNRLTEASQELARKAKFSAVSSLDQVAVEANELLAELDSYAPWQQSSGHFTPSILWAGTWGSSQDVRAALQFTLQTVSRRKSGESVKASVPAANVGVARETAKQAVGYGRDPVTGKPIDSTIVSRANELATGDLCTSDMTKVPFFGPLLCEGVGTPRFSKAGTITTFVLLIGGALFVYGLAQGVGKGFLERK